MRGEQKGEFSILNCFLIVFLLSNVLFLISFSVNTFLFCELNSFVYDQIESRVAFFLERSGRPGHVGSDKKLLKGYQTNFSNFSRLFFLSFSTWWQRQGMILSLKNSHVF